MNAGYASYVEKILESNASSDAKQVAFLRFFMTLIHETGHELDKYGKVVSQDANGHYKYEEKPKRTDEEGDKTEEYIWGTEDFKPYTRPQADFSGSINGIQSEKYKPGVTEGIVQEANKTEEGRESLPTTPTITH